MAKKRTDVRAGSGNVFADLGYPDAKERWLKVGLALEVNRMLEERGFAQDRAARLLGGSSGASRSLKTTSTEALTPARKVLD